MDYTKFAEFAPTDYAGALKKEHFMDCGMHALWQNMPRISGPAFTVKLNAGDHLMFHAAIYEAPAGSIIVADSGSMDFAVSGGNVSAIAQKNGIVGFIVDGVIRDIKEVREAKFPIYARGVMPIPGMKKAILPLNQPITCGGINVNPGDIIVADEEGIAVIPKNEAQSIYAKTKEKVEKEAKISLEEWEKAHRQKINEMLGKA
ncbi:MAG: RraA family protein [Sulfurospirillaceae bacterium]|nr:RraA family protein [Sulfurospirillaceae bacterium]